MVFLGLKLADDMVMNAMKFTICVFLSIMKCYCACSGVDIGLYRVDLCPVFGVEFHIGFHGCRPVDYYVVSHVAVFFLLIVFCVWIVVLVIMDLVVVELDDFWLDCFMCYLVVHLVNYNRVIGGCGGGS